MSGDNDTISENYPGETEGKNNRSNSGLIIILLLLLLASIFINVYQYNKEKVKEKDYTAEIFSSNELKAQLKSQLDTARLQLDEYKGRNASLDSAVKKDEKEMEDQADQISKMLKSNKINYNKYLDVKYKLDEMIYMKDKYLREIAELNEKNQQLTAENQDLKHEVKEGKHTINNLTDKVTSQKNKLSLAAMLKADKISVIGVYFKKNNKEVETSKSKNIQKLKFCFTLEENKFADAGTREVFIQVIDPSGQTVAIESLGSGVTNLEGQQSQYTVKQEIEYKNDAQDYCAYWGKDTPFAPGIYHVVMSTDGYKLGEKEIHIR